MSEEIHVPISAIEFDAATQVRAQIDADTVTSYAQEMQDGAKFPPVVLFKDGSRYWIGDGWHRLLAKQRNGDVTTPAIILKGGRSGAIRYGLGANTAHGLRRSNADKRRAVEIALREFSNLSDREIAKLCAVSHDFVNRMRPQLSSDDSSLRLGADGKVRRMPKGSNPEVVIDLPPSEETKTSPMKTEKMVAFVPEMPRKQPFKMPARGLFIARGAIAQLEGISPSDPERAEALRVVIGWCKEQLEKRTA